MSSGTIQSMLDVPAHLPERTQGSLFQRVWPKSFLVWMVAFWMVLYIIRPWEVLFPWLRDWRPERVYCVTVIAMAALLGQIRADLSRQTLALLLLFLALVISGINGTNPTASWNATYDFLIHVAMYGIVVSVIRTPRDLLFISMAYLAIMGAYLGKAEWEYFVHGRHQYTQGVPRLLGIDKTYMHYNSVACSTMLTLPFWYLLWTSRKHFFESMAAGKKKLFTLFLLGYAAVAFVAILLTNSRGGMLGFILFVLLTAVTGKRLQRAIPALIGGVLLLVALWIFAVPETQRQRFSSLWSPETGPSNAQGSLEIREQAVWDGLSIFAEHPLTGVGIGRMKAYRRQRGDTSKIEAHNVFVQAFAEMGVLGGGAFLLFIACSLLNFRRIRRQATRAESDELTFLAGFALAGRNSILLLMYFGLLGSNFDRFNWYWLAALGTVGVMMTGRAVRRARAAESTSVASPLSTRSPSIQGAAT